MVVPAGAQDNEEADDSAGEVQVPDPSTQPADNRLYITDTDTNSAPNIGLRVYGIGDDGRWIDPAVDAIQVRQAGEVVAIEETRPVDVGTFTIFLIDVTPATEGQIPTIQDTLLQFASTGQMSEQVDFVAIYRVGAESAVQALEPVGFHNSVRNFFAIPLEPEQGFTALVDSIGKLLGDVAALNPSPDKVPSIVVFSDGTDAVSAQFTRTQVNAQAVELGVPIHTVWVPNTLLTAEQQAGGRDYLTSVASLTRGRSTSIDDPAGVTALLNHILQFRTQNWFRYTAADAAGEIPVEVSFLHEPEVRAETTISISGSAPSIIINLPDDARILTLVDPAEPVELAFSTTTTWLDGIERTLQQAQLVVNGTVIAELDPANIDTFEAEISNFAFGENTLQVVVLDDQGLQAQSPTVILTVNQGTEDIIPEALQASTSFLQIALYCLIALVVIGLIGGVGFLVYSRRQRGNRRPQRPFQQATPAQAAPPPPVATPNPQPATEMFVRDVHGSSAQAAYLEVMQSDTQMAGRYQLDKPETKLGRSPDQADIAFSGDITVSRIHATITWDGQLYHIYDEQSTSGTWVNDQQLGEHGLQLLDNDEIFLGKVTLRFRQP